MHWTDEYMKANRPVALRRYRNHAAIEDDFNLIALTPGNRWAADAPIYCGEYGYLVVYSLAPEQTNE